MTALPTAMSLTTGLLVLACMPSILSWTFALSRLFGRQPLLAYEPRQTPPWSLFDIFMTVMFMIALQGIALMLFGAAGPTRLTDTGSAQWTIVITGVASLIACALGASLIVLRTNANWGKDLGLTLRHAGRDVVYGIVAFAMLAPIIYLIQLILVQWYPSKHPLVESFRADPTLSFYLVCVFSAAFVAPIVEEFICRMLLQGWLERVLGAKSLKNVLFSLPDMAVRQGETGEAAATNSDMPPIETNEAKSAEELNAPDPAADAPGVLGGAVPIVFSSLVFATLHWNHGPDPIPLFILAIGLGYLYQRTHRILPCVVLHFLVNAFSLAMLALSLVVE